MTVSSRVWLVTFVSLVFLIGASAGILVDRAWLIQPPANRFGPQRPALPPGPPQGPSPDRIVADLDSELHFTDIQRQQIVAILEAHRPRVRQLQDDARQRFVDEQQALHDEINKTLTADQSARFKTMAVGPEGPGRPGGPRGRLGPGGRMPPPGRGRGRE